jgi:hypothetical protein
MSLARENANREAAAAGATMRCTATTVCASPFVAPSERLFGAAAAMNMNTESGRGRGSTSATQQIAESDKRTESHVGDAYRRELQHDKQPHARALRPGGEVLEREHGVDDHVRRDTGEDDAPRSQTRHDAREHGELDDGVQTPVAGQP